VSHTFRELLPHTVLADMLHDYQIQCIGTGQHTNFTVLNTRDKNHRKGKPLQLLEKRWQWNWLTKVQWTLWAPFTNQNTNTDGREATSTLNTGVVTEMWGSCLVPCFHISQTESNLWWVCQLFLFFSSSSFFF